MMAGWEVLEKSDFHDALPCKLRGVDLKIAAGVNRHPQNLALSAELLPA